VIAIACPKCTSAVKNPDMPYRPTGIALDKVPLYKPDSSGMFTCIDGSKKIPFDQVNDDYCDCGDSSDEPGTSACADGRFVCANHGYIPVTILSSRVNDHVCDCCDGSDEYNSGKQCANTCTQERQKQMELFKVYNEGYKKRQDLITQAKKDMEEKQKQLKELDSKLTTENTKLSELLKVKDDAEAPEKEAKDKYDSMLKEIKEKFEREQMEAKSAEAFKEIDTDSNQMLTLEELLSCASIDGSNQCGVAEDEVKGWYPVDKTELDIAAFREFIWTEKLDKHFKTLAEKQVETLDSQNIEEDSHKDEFEDASADENEEDDQPDYELKEDDPKHEERHAVKESFPKELELPEMDEETKKLIEVATDARGKYKEQEKVTRDIEREKEDLQKDIDLDVGKEREFQHLLKKCFDYNEKEYTYTFCPFDKGAQKPKSGSETNLGRWGEWTGPPTNKYPQMKLTKGQRCWNGPDRSLTVNFECGLEDKVLTTSEPSMCEYVMSFSTPALCTRFVEFDQERRVHEDL